MSWYSSIAHPIAHLPPYTNCIAIARVSKPWQRDNRHEQIAVLLNHISEYQCKCIGLHARVMRGSDTQWLVEIEKILNHYPSPRSIVIESPDRLLRSKEFSPSKPHIAPSDSQIEEVRELLKRTDSRVYYIHGSTIFSDRAMKLRADLEIPDRSSIVRSMRHSGFTRAAIAADTLLSIHQVNKIIKDRNGSTLY